jgi:hypothetical protein
MAQGIDVRTPPDVGSEPGGLADAAGAAFGRTIGGPIVDPYGDDKALLKQFSEFCKEAFDQRAIYERLWWRNLLYILGRQWIYYDSERTQWRDKRMAKWVPRPVTNKMGETLDAVMSVFGSVQLATTTRPDGADPKDIQTAETVNKLAPAIHLEHQMDRVTREGDFWLISTGNVFYHPWWDKRGGPGGTMVPFEQCVACGAVHGPDEVLAAGNTCPDCGAPTLQTALSPDGVQIGEQIAQGKGCTDACSPLEIAFPLSYTIWDDLPGLVRKRWRTKMWADANLPKEILKKIQWEKQTSDRSLQLYRGLATQSDITSGPLSAYAGGGGEATSEGYTEYEQWMKPSKTYPDGLVLRVAGEGDSGTILRMDDQSLPGPLPYKTAQGNPMFSWIHVPYTRFGGRVWGRSPIDVLITKQDQINQIDSLIQLIIQRVANPVWLEPKGTEVKKFTGEPGLVVKYNPLALGGATAKPERMAGENVPSSLFQIREQLYSDIENLAGTYDIIKGQKPTGVEAFSALQLLVERSQSRYGPVLANRGEAYRTWFSQAVELERQYGPVERTWAVLGPNQAWTFQTFKQANLQGAIRIVVEDGSQTPKTSLGKRAAIEQLNQLGVIAPQTNPDTAYAILETFGQTDLWPGLDTDVKSALQEQDDFERWAAQVEQIPAPIDPMTGQPQLQPGPVDPQTGQPAGGPQPMGPQLSVPPPGARKPWHNDQVHLAEHKKWANQDTVRQILQAKPWIEPYVGWLIQQHEFMLQLQAQQQAMMAAGPPKGEGGVGGGRAMKNSAQESGNPADVPRGNKETPTGQGPM